MKGSHIIVLLLLLTLPTIPIISVKADDTKYHYESDTIRWYYEKIPYERPYFYPFYYYYPYYYYFDDGYYKILYFPYYAVSYAYRNVKVYEYYLKVTSQINGAATSGSGWYREGATATVSASSEVSGDSGVKYLFSGWSGDLSGLSPTASITMDAPKTVIASYRTQYLLSIRSSPPEALGLIEQSWVAEGQSKSLPAAPEVVNTELGKRYVFDSWFIDGARTAGNPITIMMDKPHEAEARYKIQYYLKVESLFGYPTGSGWYDEGEVATFAVSSPVQAGLGRNWVFDHWLGDVVTNQPQASVVMDGPKTVSASWRLDSTALYVIYGIIVTLIVASLVIIVFSVTRYLTSAGHLKGNTCKRCGYRLAEGFSYCPICGTLTGVAQVTRKGRT